MSRIKTLGKDGINYFFHYSIEEQFDRNNELTKLCFKTVLDGLSPNDWFDFKIAPVGNQIYKVTDMFDTKGLYRGKGLPEQLILEAQKLFSDHQIISSSNKKPQLRSEWRTVEASAVWERLRRMKKAEYDEPSDFYYLLKYSH